MSAKYLVLAGGAGLAMAGTAVPAETQYYPPPPQQQGGIADAIIGQVLGNGHIPAPGR